MADKYVDLTHDTTETVMGEDSLAGWVGSKLSEWRDHYESNYRKDHDEYYRLWRGKWSTEDKTRETERSRIVSPALQQAVEANVADIEEATFGRGRWFSIKDDVAGKEQLAKQAAEEAQRQAAQQGGPQGVPTPAPNAKRPITDAIERLHEDFAYTRTMAALSEAALTAAVFGTGIVEIVVDQLEHKILASRPMMDGSVTAYGVESKERTFVKHINILPRNFLIDPSATCIEDAMGCAVDRMVGLHTIKQLQEAGVYRKCVVGAAAPDNQLSVDPTLADQPDDTARLSKYYGLVPRHMLEAAQEAEKSEEETVVILDDSSVDADSYYVEAIVVLANDGTLLKAEANPYMMNDRPVVAFPWDPVPGRFWGRGVCEKGYNSQKALDAELRARIDALALTVHPMMAFDATRFPRGQKPQIRPGKTIMVNGNPAEAMMPFKFGTVDQITFNQAAELQKMVMQSTGALDASGMPSAAASGDGTAAGMSMAIGAVMKRHRRTLLNFQTKCVIPVVTKSAWRYMQFEPERYPIGDYTFITEGTMGMVAREYEVSQLVQVMQNIQPESEAHGILLDAVVEGMNLSKSDNVLSALKAARQPNPDAQAQAQRNAEADIQFKENQSVVLQAQAAESEARAAKYYAEAKATPEKVEVEKLKFGTQYLQPGDNDDKEFDKRMRVLEFVLKSRKQKAEEKAAGVKLAPTAESTASP